MSYNPQNPNGQATMAASAPVVLPSDQVVPIQVGVVEELMAALLNRLGPIGLAVDPVGGRLRVLIDPLGGAQTVGTVTTVGTVSTITNIPQVGSLNTAYDQLAQMQAMVTPLRAGIGVTA